MAILNELMSEQNVELSRRAMDAFNAHDAETFTALFDPSIEVHSVFAAIGGAVYHGHDGVRTWLRELEETWGEEIRVEPEAYFDLGEQTLAFVVMRGRGRQSGAEVALPAAQLLGWRDGLGVYYKAYANREDALSELRLSEDALAPIAP
jgi:ketosteroid isomerase-like protein